MALWTPKIHTYTSESFRNKDGSLRKNLASEISARLLDMRYSLDFEYGDYHITSRREANKIRDAAKRYGVGFIVPNIGQKNIDFIDRGGGYETRVYDLTVKKDREAYLRDFDKMYKRLKGKVSAPIAYKNYGANVRPESLERRIKKYEKLSKSLKGRVVIRRPLKVNRTRLGGGIATNYVYKFKDYTDDFLENVDINIDKVLSSVIPKHPDSKYIVRLSSGINPFNDTTAYGVKTYGKPSIGEMKRAIEKKMKIAIEKYAEEFETEMDFKTIGVSVISEPYGQILGQGGHKSHTSARSHWFISDQTSRTNCFYRCIATDNLLSKMSNDNELDRAREELVENPQKFLDRVNGAAKDIKKRLKANNVRAVSEDEIQKYVDKCYTPRSACKCEVKIYNNVFKLIKTIRPKEWDGKPLKKSYEIQNINHHFVALIRWYKVTNIKPILDEVIQIATQKANELKEFKNEIVDENSLIDRGADLEIADWDKFKEFCEKEVWDKETQSIKPVDYENANAATKNRYERWFKSRYGLKAGYCNRFMCGLNLRIGAYDLEATPNGVSGDIFVAYRLSFAYNILDGENLVRMKTVSFGGRNCVEKWFEWLYENRNELSGYTFYAHNGGKFDVMLLLSDYILKKTSKWVLEEGTLIVLNGAYLSFSLTSKEGDASEIQSVAHSSNSWTLEKNIDRKKNKQSDGIECLITFRDSMRLLPGSLKKLCDEFDVEHKKISEVVDFNEVNINNCFGGELQKHRPLSDEKFKIELCNLVYCNYDVIGLLEILNKFSKSVYEACNGINITDCITGASLSKKHYFNSFYDKKNFPVWNLSNEYDEFCRAGYYGGRCEAFYIGEMNKKLYYYDFTSLYPDVGRKRLPYGKPVKVEKDRIDKWNLAYSENRSHRRLFRGIVKVKVKTKNFDALPLHAVKNEFKLTFAHFSDWTELTMWYRELEYGVELDIYEYELIDVIEFQGGDGVYCATAYVNNPNNNKKGILKDKEHYWDEGILKEFFEDAVNKKALAKKNGQPALAQAYKIIANSGYGFWGLNANGDGEGRDGMTILNENDDYFWELMANGVVSNIGKIGDYILVRTAMMMKVKDFNVAIATAICSEARMKTYRFLKAVRDNGCNILYCDTDSCICDLKLNDYPDMMKEFCWDGTGEELGSMKNECLEKVEGYYKGKILKELGEDTPKSIWKPLLEAEVKKEMDKDGGELSFDKGIIAGCKQYSLHKTLLDGGVVCAGACKGVKRKLKYEEFQHLLYGTMLKEQREIEFEIMKRNPEFQIPDGYRLYERQTQFRSSTSDHITEGTYTEIRRIQIDKSLRINYTKGIIENEGWVKPHIL